ncbi:hypothetical protein [Pseudophaeobacter flagellatus]|uniref:hypothetical protein n=1 Tax=Pseudophaeobacter flagellatus TaxID=2899119 RepID=UPI001E607EA7|nr:hypothetical protein [Pseudophaeobacter flagellatus]MCD9146638.1 hypothetical protein [Pseudophaeobacter flagellatus]
MEKILGAKIQSIAELGIDGLKDKHGNEAIFFAVPEAESPRKVFRKLISATDPPNAKSGGASEYGCSIKTPNGLIYHALTTHGDIEGWRKDIEFGAAQFGFSLAKIQGNKFVVDEKQEIEIYDCSIEFS